MIKDAQEVLQLKGRSHAGIRRFEVVAARLKPGVAESHVAAELEYVARRLWGPGMSLRPS